MTAALRCILALAAGLLLAGTASAQGAAERAWAVKTPTVEKVVFRGVVSHDAAGMGTGSMLYPAPNAAGLLAAILTHGLLNESAKQAQKTKLQADADTVLQPFATVLSGFTNAQLIRSALPRQKAVGTRRAITADEGPGLDWVVETAPVFSMTRDQRALVLDNAVRIYAPATADAAYAQTIRVVSAPLAAAGEAGDSAAVEQAWLADQGKRLLDESAALFAESLDVAMANSQQGTGLAESPHRTFRYPEGGVEKMERAQLVEARCGRALLRTLRGWLMSVPVKLEGEAACSGG